MGTILLEEQEGEVKRKFITIMSKFVLKGEEVKYTDLSKEIEKQKLKNRGTANKRPKAAGL